MNDDELIAQIRKAQAAPTVHYLLWARVDGEAYALGGVAIAVTMTPDEHASHLQGEARRRLRDLGHDPAAVAGAEIFLDDLPDVIPILEKYVAEMKAGGSDHLLLDTPHWEAARLQTRCDVVLVANSDREIVYKGLHVRCSAVA